MRIIPGDEVAIFLGQLTAAQRQHQVRSREVDVTLRTVQRVGAAGVVDCAGKDYRAATREPIAPARRTPEERSEWWRLDRGIYFIGYNESIVLPKFAMAILQPAARLLAAGAWHPTLLLVPDQGSGGVLAVPLSVPVAGLELEHGARVSTIVVIHLDED